MCNGGVEQLEDGEREGANGKVEGANGKVEGGREPILRWR